MTLDERREPFAALARWAVLAGVTVAVTALFTFARIPAPALIGAIAVAIFLGQGLKLPRWIFLGAQAVIGCMIGQSLTGDLLATFAVRWPLVLAVAASTVGLSVAFGWGLYKSGLLDRATALWGSLPGAASAMVIMSEASGANMGLVAFVQYVRVVSVAVLAALAGGALAHDGAATVLAATHDSFAGLGVSLAIVAILTLLATRIPLIGLCLIGGLVLAGGVQLGGIASVWLPDWLLVCAYCLIGWQVGLTAGRETLSRARGLLVPVLSSTVVLLLVSAVIALGIDHLFGVGMHTAFLATIPGGLDAVAIIAASTGADVAFVMLFQTTRFLLVVLLGVPILIYLLRARDRGEQREKP